MLTVKLMKSSGAEELHSGKSIGFNPVNKRISISGIDQTVCLNKGDIAYVMNENGKTVSSYQYCTAQQ